MRMWYANKRGGNETAPVIHTSTMLTHIRPDRDFKNWATWPHLFLWMCEAKMPISHSNEVFERRKEGRKKRVEEGRNEVVKKKRSKEKGRGGKKKLRKGKKGGTKKEWKEKETKGKKFENLIPFSLPRSPFSLFFLTIF